MLKQTSIKITIGGIDSDIFCEYDSDTGYVSSAQYGTGGNVEIDDQIREAISDIMMADNKYFKRRRAKK